MTEATTAAAGEAVPAETIELSLRWMHTSDDLEGHYTAYAPTLAQPVGCISRSDGGRIWGWAVTADDYEISRNCGPMNGQALSARHAAKAVERAWFAAIRGTSHDRPAAAVNGYAAAKHRHAAA